VRDVARAAGGPAYVFYAPFTVRDAATARALREQPEVAQAFHQLPRVSKAVAGVGFWGPGQSTLYDAAEERDRTALRRLGVCADISGVFLSADGEPVKTELSERMIGIDAEQMRAIPEVIAMEALLGKAPRSLRTCHRDLWADNVRRTPGGGLCVFDFDNAGLADPSGELAAVLVEYAGADPARARTLRGAYEEAGGPARVERPTDFAMPIAQLAHIVEEGCRRWLAATDDAGRADNAGWVREYLDRPLTRDLIAGLLP